MLAFLGIPNPIDIVTAPFRWGAGQLRSAGAGVVKEAFQWIAGLLLSGVAWLFDVVWSFVSESTTPHLYAAWFIGGPFAVMRTLAIAVLMMAVMLAIAEAIWNRDGAGLLRAVLQDMPKAMFTLTGLLFVTTLGLGIADGVSTMLMSLFSTGTTDFAASMANVAGQLQFGAGLLVVILLGLVMLLVLLFVALMMVFREGFIYLLTAITAVMIVLDVYRPTRGAGARSWRLLAGVIAAKPIIALCFALGGQMLGGAGAASPSTEAIAEPGTEAAVDPQVTESVIGENADDLAATVGTLLGGMATMCLAAFAPFSVLRLFPAADAGAAGEGQKAVTSSVRTAAITAGSAVASGGASVAGGAAGGMAAGVAAGGAGSASAGPAVGAGMAAAQKAG